ncbi:hypothetical protein [Flavobacterium sp.]|uniref:hypothetical protein n=1 Tax=Flavobacterium sp. TaxID=239 RepID=UPI002616C88D|nr:hypothetical protein [Flavobacterium sp.]
MMSRSLPILFAAGLLFVSCKKELMPQESSDTPNKANTTAANPAQPAQSAAMPQQPQTVQATPTAAPAQATAPGMNPPHGQPGHRCDIAVGAPLNSPKAAAAKPGVSTIQPGITMTPGKAVKTAPGMNPPHGEPGHRCDISVGAPLSSAPAKAATTTTAAPTQVPAILAAPAETETKQ